MRINVDAPACNTLQRPLFYYALTDGLVGGLVTPAVMRARGFTLHRCRASRNRNSLEYWYHPGAKVAPVGPECGRQGTPPTQPTLTPLVFVHGVGIGPLPYAHFISELLHSSDGAPMLVVELPFVAQRISGISRAPHEERTVAEVADAMAHHGIMRATFVGHSLGTVYLAWLARRRPDLLASCVFIDPIVFLLHHHNVAQAFLYSRPERSNHLEKVMRFFITSEHSIVSFFHRHFYWYACILWKDELRCPSAVVLASQDRIVPVKAVTQYLLAGDTADTTRPLSRLLRRRRRPHVRRLLTLDGLSHGAFLVEPNARRAVLETISDAQAWGAAECSPKSKPRSRCMAFSQLFKALAAGRGRGSKVGARDECIRSWRR